MMCYTVAHETIWKPSAVREAAPTRHPAAPGGHDARGSGRGSRRLEEFRGSLEESPSEEGCQWIRSQTGSWSPSQIDRLAKEEACDVAPARSSGIGLSHGPVDHSQSAGGNSEAVRDRVPPESSLAVSRGVGVELPEAGEAGQGKGRRGHCSMEETPLAPYKKRPEKVVPTLYFLMKRAVCLFPMFAGPGRLVDRHLFCDIAAGENVSRSFRRLPSVPNGNIWDCTGVITRPISRVFRCALFSAICCVILRGRSSLCGTRIRRTRAASPRSSLRGILASIRSSFPAMPLSSTLMSMSGQTSNATWPIRLQTISRKWHIYSRILYSDFVDHKNYYHPVFVHPPYRGKISCRPITYA